MFDVKVRAKKKSAHKLNKKTTYMQEELACYTKPPNCKEE